MANTVEPPYNRYRSYRGQVGDGSLHKKYISLLHGNYHVCILGAILTTEDTSDIRENSTMTRSLCVRLVSFGAGLEREVNITLTFMSLSDFASECKSS